MSTLDFFRSRLDQMVDLRHPLAVLATRLPWASIEATVSPKLAHQAKPAKRVIDQDLAGTFDGEFGGGISPAGRPPAAAGPVDGQLAVFEEQLQPQRRRVGRAVGRERAVAVFRRHGLLRAAPAVRRHPDRALSAPAG